MRDDATDDVTAHIEASSKRLFTESAGNFTAPVDYNATLVKTGSSTTERYTLTQTSTGIVFVFYGFDDDISSYKHGRLLERTNQYFQETSQSGFTFVYNANGQVFSNTSSQGWSIIHSYHATTKRRTKVEVKDGSNNPIQKVEYTYYDDVTSPSTDIGSPADLVLVKYSTLNSDGSTWSVSYIHYRYYRDADSDGDDHELKAVYKRDAVERILTAGDTAIDTTAELLSKDDSYAVNSGNTVAQYTTRSFTYYASNLNTDNAVTTPWGSENLKTKYGGLNLDESRFVKTETISAGCVSCGGGGSGAGTKRTYFYTKLSQGGSPPNDEVVYIIIEDTEDGSGGEVARRIYGLNDNGRILRNALIEDPTLSTIKAWCSSTVLDSNYRITEQRSPSAHTTVVDTDAEMKKFLDPKAATNDSDTLNASDGVIELYTINSDGYRTETKVKKGKNGTAYYTGAKDFGDGTNDKPKHLVIATYSYPTKETVKTNGKKTTIAYTFWDSGDTQVKTVTQTLPAIPTTQNGSNVASVGKDYFDDGGRLRWRKDGEGYVEYRSYHPDLGLPAYQMTDVDTASLDTEITSGSTGKWIAWSGGVPTGFTRESGLDTALELVSKTEYDDQSRRNKSIDRSGAEHFTVYDGNKRMQFLYWDVGLTPDAPHLPIQVMEIDASGQVTQQYSVDPARAASTSGVPTGLTSGTDQSHYVSWSKNNYNDSGQLESSDAYHDIPSTGDGTLSTNFYRSIRQYDDEGRIEYSIQVVSGTSPTSGVEQVTQRIYDFAGRVIETKTGVSSASHNMGTSYATKPTLRTVSKVEFDSGGVGDGRVTKSKRYHGTGANDYTGSNNHYDWRGRGRGTEPFYHNGSSEVALGPFPVRDVDWMRRTTASAIYDTNPTWSTVIGDDDFADTVATNRRSLSKTYFDDLGRTYKSENYTINSSTGAKGNKTLSNTYYDRLGRSVGTESVNGAASETAYDGAGRSYQTRTVTELEATKYTSGAFNYRAPLPDPTLSSMTGGDDNVIELRHTEFDSTSTLPTKRYALEINHNDTTFVGLDVTDDDDYIITYAYSWYDDANRVTDSVNYGTATTSWKYNGTAPTYGGSAPTRSDTELVTSTEYDAVSGRAIKVTDPAATVSRTWFDDQGRQTYIAENYVNFVASTEANTGGSDTSEDRVTKFEYNALSQSVLTALDADGNGNLSDNQATTYLFEDAVSASLQTNIIYPDSADTTSSGTDQVKMVYNVGGSLSKKTDQLGTVVDYTYTNSRKPDLEKVTTLGTDVDGHVRSIKREYDDLGRLDTITNYANSDGTGTIRSQILLEFADFGNVSKSWQSNEGAKGAGTPNVQYTLDLSVDGNSVYDDGPRPKDVTYPDGRVDRITYDGVDSIWDIFNLVHKRQRTDWANLVSYLYNGAGRMVQANYLIPDFDLNYIQGGVDYIGFDRFGRVDYHRWQGYGATADVENFQYTFDRNSNRLTRDIATAIYSTNDKDQYYVYEGLDRLDKFHTGTLSGGTITDANANFRQHWDLDQLGNWTDFYEDANGDDDFSDAGDLDQDRTHNDANEITGITEVGGQMAWVDPVINAAGNMTEGPTPSPGSGATKQKYVYDAWNRLVKVTDASDVSLGEYEYDGLNRRIVRKVYVGGSLDATYDYYFNESWQILEVRLDGDADPWKQYLWHDYYIDALAITWYDADTDGTGIQEIYFTNDANYNVTAAVDNTGSVLERYEYDAYGQPSILDSDFSDDADGESDIEQEVLFAGYRLDTESGLIEVRNRQYHPQLGRWMQRDPAGYRDGNNLYQYVSSNPMTRLDPSGLDGIWINCDLSGDNRIVKRDGRCLKWVEQEMTRGNAWINDLPDCPCTIAGVPPNDLEDRDDQWWPSNLWVNYHPRGQYQYRIPGQDGHAQQCIYDSNGNLITGGRSAGTPDWVYPDSSPVVGCGGPGICWIIPFLGNPLSLWRHKREDVDSFEDCRLSDMLGLYHTFRPPNNGNNCAANIVD